MAKKETTAAAALEIIVSRYGIDTFRDRRRAFALLTDLAPGDANAKDRRRIRQALDSGAAEILLKAAESGTGGELHPFVIEPQGVREGDSNRRLADARNVIDQDMAPCQDGSQNAG